IWNDPAGTAPPLSIITLEPETQEAVVDIAAEVGQESAGSIWSLAKTGAFLLSVPPRSMFAPLEKSVRGRDVNDDIKGIGDAAVDSVSRAGSAVLDDPLSAAQAIGEEFVAPYVDAYNRAGSLGVVARVG